MSLVAAHTLVPHGGGAASCDVLAVIARAELAAGEVLFDYQVTGAIRRLAIPARAMPRRADRLWDRTCFEAFIAFGEGSRYYELNFSPSTEWAAYELDEYRKGLRPLALTEPPFIEVAETPDSLRVTARVAAGSFATAPWPWRVGLTAVIADRAGERRYYALRHMRDKPDFHDAVSFAASLDGSVR